jgi:hypothetical protein
MRVSNIAAARSGLRPSTSYRISRSRELNGSLCVTVDTSQLLRVRRAIVQCGCEHVGIVKVMRLACGTRVRLVIALEQGSVATVTKAITDAVDEAHW